MRLRRGSWRRELNKGGGGAHVVVDVGVLFLSLELAVKLAGCWFLRRGMFFSPFVCARLTKGILGTIE